MSKFEIRQSGECGFTVTLKDGILFPNVYDDGESFKEKLESWSKTLPFYCEITSVDAYDGELNLLMKVESEPLSYDVGVSVDDFGENPEYNFKGLITEEFITEEFEKILKALGVKEEWIFARDYEINLEDKEILSGKLREIESCAEQNGPDWDLAEDAMREEERFGEL